jgi:colanic acid biosynthesis protein WcaH
LKHRQLEKDEFLEIIDKTPLVSIDLVIRDSANRILLGRRVNEPAKGKWFVPGGRIMKGESINDAFERITKAEIGIKHSRSEARLIGAYTHLYDTNVFLKDGISTHYIALAFELQLADNIEVGEKAQHNEYKWFAIEEADPDVSKSADPDVHKNVLEYFRVPSMMDESQYEILNARRDSFNNLVWQTPVLSLTAQAFLFTIILSGGVPELGRTIAAFLASIAALMSLQLLSKHRFMEEQHAKILQVYEEIHKSYSANRFIRAPNWTVRFSSYWLWRVLLWAFFIASIVSLQLIRLGLLKNSAN